MTTPQAISLYSQITGGIVESRETMQEQARSADNKRNYDFKVFRHDAGGTENNRSGVREVVKPHHALLAELEQELRQHGYLIDLSRTPESLRNPELRNRLARSLFVKVEGRAVIEDYERIKGIAEAFPEIVKLVNKSIESKINDSPEYKELQKTLEAQAAQLKGIKDRNARAVKEAELKSIKDALQALTKSASLLGGVDQWILDGLKKWIDTFLPGIINLRVYPSPDRPDEQIFGHLKRSYFEDSDSNSFHFTYGSMPTENISVLGVVTSVPPAEEDPFSPLAEFKREGLADHETVEKAFRGVFRGFDGMEQMIRTCRFPRVLVQPLIVYRSVEPTPVTTTE